MQLNQLIKRISSLKIQGATQIALESLKFLKTQPYSKWNSIIKRLEKVRPTAVVLHNAMGMAKKEKDANKIIRRLKTTKQKVAEKGSKLIKNNYNIMIKCHSTHVLEVVKYAKKQGKKITVYVLETEPKHQGILSAKELSRAGINTVIIEDPASGFFMKEMNIVMVGCDSIRKQGVYNKIGTYVLALAAIKHKKPFYVIGTSFKFDRRKKIKIEERPIDELYKGLKETKYMKVRNPAFDLTPYDLISRVVTEHGIMTSGNIKRLLK